MYLHLILCFPAFSSLLQSLPVYGYLSSHGGPVRGSTVLLPSNPTYADGVGSEGGCKHGHSGTSGCIERPALGEKEGKYGRYDLVGPPHLPL